MPINSYKKAVEYVESLIPNKNTGKRIYKLERVRRLLELCGNPHETFASIHVGGTAGKGSVSYLSAGILQEAGYKVGLHVSPHIENVNERMQFQGEKISDKDFKVLTAWMKPKIERVGKETDGLPTYFEALVAMSFEYFRRKKADVAVVEVGLGGGLDATNVLIPLVSVITNIHFDHRGILGWTIGAIARQKAGIIKQGVPVITGATQKEALEAIEQVAKKKYAPLIVMGKEIKGRVTQSGTEGLVIDIKTKKRDYKNIKTPLLGEHQSINIATALTAIEKSKLKVSQVTIKKALGHIRIPGRMETFNFDTIYGQKTIILDGAHNPKKMESLSNALRKLFPKKKCIFIIAMKKGKNQTGTIRRIAGIAKKIYFTQFLATTDFGKKKSKSPRSLSYKAKQVSKNLPRRIAQSPEHALHLAVEEFHGDEIIVVTGSLYLIGEVRRMLVGERISA